MARILLWNIQRREIADRVASLAQEHNVDFILLIESQLSPGDLPATLNSGDEFEAQFFHLESPDDGEPLIQLYSRFPEQTIEKIDVKINRINAWSIRGLPSQELFLLVGIHGVDMRNHPPAE